MKQVHRGGGAYPEHIAARMFTLHEYVRGRALGPA